MRALRIIIKQSSANYKKEETIDNAMTYPMPPPSTVIGALHEACGFKEYKNMDLSIQGKFESMKNDFYKRKLVYNNVTDDRGNLVKMANDNISKAYTSVAKSLERGSSYKKKEKIIILNNELLERYIYLVNRIKALDKKIDADEIKLLKKELSTYRTIESIPSNREILYNIELIIHIRVEEKVLNLILDNIYNLKSIGRSEDFIEVTDCQIVELIENADYEVKSFYSAYINKKNIEGILTFDNKKIEHGTVYYLNKDYKIIDNKRIFNKIKVLYISRYKINHTSENLLIDKGIDRDYIVNFI